MPNPVTAATVRAYFAADAARVERLPEEARKSVASGARGRIHPDAIKAFNGKRAKAKRYQTGATKEATATRKSQAQDLRVQARAAGFEVGERGPLPKAFLATVK